MGQEHVETDWDLEARVSLKAQRVFAPEIVSPLAFSPRNSQRYPRNCGGVDDSH